MMVNIISGNIFNSTADAIVNTVNCVGIMGKGLALNFKNRYPEMYRAYRFVCNKRQLRPGMILPYSKLNDSEPLILNFAVKDHWRNPSRYECSSCSTCYTLSLLTDAPEGLRD